MARARRKLFDLHVNHASQIAEVGLKFFGQIYEAKHEACHLDAGQRLQLRQA